MDNDSLQPKFEPLKTLEFENKPCPVCKENDGDLKFEKVLRGITMEYWTCRNCTALYAKRRATVDSLRSIYSSADFFQKGEPGDESRLDYYDFIGGETFLRRTAKDRLSRIAQFCKAGKMLEVASAAGFFLIEAKLAGYDISGVEFSGPMARYASSRWDVPVIANSIELQELPPETYDAIASWGVMTIIQDPVAAIRKFHRALKPGGVWAFNTYYHDSLWARWSGRKWYILGLNFSQILSRKHLIELISSEGFELVSRSRDKPYTDMLKLTDILSINLGIPWLPKLLQKIGIHNWIVRVPLPDVMEYVWRKKTPAQKMAA